MPCYCLHPHWGHFTLFILVAAVVGTGGKGKIQNCVFNRAEREKKCQWGREYKRGLSMFWRDLFLYLLDKQ